MAQENVEVVRQAIEANGSDNPRLGEAAAAFWDSGCVYTSVMAALEPATYHGHDGIRRYLSDLAKRWAEWRTEPEEVFDVDPDTVFASFRFRAVGKDSGVPVEARLASVFVLSQGKLLRGRTYRSREEALEAVGLAQ
jgi:ketosteroid isomerase-like protein